MNAARSAIPSGLLLAACLAAPAAAQERDAPYPNHPLRLIAPFPAGGSSDLVARVLAQGITESLGQQVIIDNRPGAGGSLGTALVARSVPDGYTLLLGGVAPVTVNVHLYQRVGYDSTKDFEAVSTVANAPTVLVIHPSVPVKDLKQLIALARRKPDALACGSGGVGVPAHLCCEMLKLATHVQILHVPYKGTGQSVNDLLGGQIQMVFASMPVGIPHVRAGKLRALAVTGAKRTPQAPDIPTLAEAGVPSFEFESWWGVLVPARTPRAIVERLAEVIGRVGSTAEVRERFAALGIDPYLLPPAQFSNLIRAEVAKFGTLIKEAGIRAE